MVTMLNKTKNNQMKKLLFLFIACMFCLLFFGCESQEEVFSQRFYIDVKESTVEAIEYNKWHYFSFSQGKVVGVGNANLTTDAEWAERTDWDIAFTTLYVRLNGGASSKKNAQGTAVEMTTLAGTDKQLVFNTIVGAPTNGTYTKDTKATGKAPLVIGTNPEVTYPGSYNTVVSSWISFNQDVSNGGDYLSSRKTFVMKTADGKYVKVILKSFLEGMTGLEPVEYVKDAETGENTEEIIPSTARKGIITFSYAYQPDGTDALMTEKY